MNTTEDKLNLLLQTKADLKAALIEQGQDVTDETPFSAYPDLVRAIQGGPVIKPATVFGVMWDYSNPSTALTRLTPDNDPNGYVTIAVDSEPVPAVGGGEGSSPFDSYMPWAGMEEYNIINGAVSYKRGEDGFSRTAYDTMVYIPEFWFYFVDSSATSKRYWYISGEEKDGFTKHPGSGRYVGRYISCDIYFGIMASISDATPYTNITRAQARLSSTEKGNDWYQEDIATWCARCLLYLVEYADFDSQSKIGRGYVDGNSDAINSGATDSMSYHTGRASGDDGKTAVQYRHIENPCGNVYQWVDGANFNDRASYICLDPSKYADDTTTNYSPAGVSLASANGYIKSLGLSLAFPWAFLPDESDGSGTTYVPDRVYSNTGWRVLCVGGYWSSGSNAGLFCFNANNTSSNTNTNIGARLLYIPD